MSNLDDRIAELIQVDVDGLLDESDRKELNAALEESADAREFHREMVHLNNLLFETPDLEPPAGLNSRILDSIELPTVRQLPVWLVGWFQPLSYGLAVAAGMIIAVGVVNFFPFSDEDMNSLVGSMVQEEDILPIASQGQLGVDLEAVQGTVLLKKLNGAAMALQFEIFSADSVKISIDLTDSGLQFGGFAHDTEGPSDIEVSGGNVQVSNRGKNNFVVFLRQPKGAESGVKNLGVTITQEELRIFRGSIAVDG